MTGGALVLVVLGAGVGPPTATALLPWGYDGHRMAGRAAAAEMPREMPAFFREGAARLEYLNYEPDRWRSRELRAMDQAFSYDHYVDLENVPAHALEATDRWEYLRRLYRSGLQRPERDAGFLPYRIVELYQRLASGFARWRTAGPEERPWIEERIVNDAGILGHYVTDASQPHHTTIHFNGWAEDAPNPEGFTRARDFHARFESEFVRAHVDLGDVLGAMAGEVRPVDDVRDAVLAHVRRSHDQVRRLYELERDVGFDPAARTPDPRLRAFAAERLADGARMLRVLWYSAWVESGGE